MGACQRNDISGDRKTKGLGGTPAGLVPCLILLCLCSLLGMACGSRADVAFVPGQAENLQRESGKQQEAVTAEAVSGEEWIYVYVCGAVTEPGLKKLPAQSRVWDALELAGGFSPEADPSAVNLAAFIEDGQKIYFPSLEERSASDEKDGRVDLNTADEKELQTLPGIGSAKAQAILNYRKDHGSFTRVEQLLEVPGIKERLFEQIRDMVKAAE